MTKDIAHISSVTEETDQELYSGNINQMCYAALVWDGDKEW